MDNDTKKYSGKCVVCGETFTSSFPWTKTCSREHQYKWTATHQKEVWNRYYKNNKEKILEKNRRWEKAHAKKNAAST